MFDNFEFKKSFGQNFIKDDNIIRNIIKYANIDKDTLVIEVGPGGGSLSKYIVPLSKYSILYEREDLMPLSFYFTHLHLNVHLCN